MIIVGSTNSMDHMAELSNTIFDSGLIGKEVRIRIRKEYILILLILIFDSGLIGKEVITDLHYRRGLCILECGR
jgi:hypothetical protein